MGCDIHAYEEWKIGGAWHLGKQHDIGRSYELFSRMCGVRADGDSVKPIAPRRGLPSDVSVAVAAIHKAWAGDAHNESWLTWDEVISLHDEWKGKYPLSNVFGWPDEPPSADGVAGRRLIVWFDN